MGTDPRSFFRERVIMMVPEVLYPNLLRHMPCTNCGPVYGHVKYHSWNEVFHILIKIHSCIDRAALK